MEVGVGWFRMTFLLRCGVVWRGGQVALLATLSAPDRHAKRCEHDAYTGRICTARTHI